MPKDVYRFPCPCCGKLVEVNVRSGRARAVHPDEARGGSDLDSLLQKQKREGHRLGHQFEDALEQQKSDRERLEDLLRKAKDDAKKDRDPPG